MSSYHRKLASGNYVDRRETDGKRPGIGPAEMGQGALATIGGEAAREDSHEERKVGYRRPVGDAGGAGQPGDPGQEPADAEVQPVEPLEFTEEVTVTVTARKREENLQAVPFSVVAPTQQALRNRGAESIEDVSANVAGFSVQNLGPGQSQIAMRGVSAGQIVRDQPGVKE